MTVQDQILAMILESPGVSRTSLLSAFGLTDYRLNRVFRHMERGEDWLSVFIPTSREGTRNE